LFTQIKCMGATAISFLLFTHIGGGDTAPAFSGWHVYLQFTWEVSILPSPVEFSPLCHFYKLSCLWLLGVCHLLRPAYLFTVPPSSALRAPYPLCCVSFFFVIAYYSVFLFSLGEGQSVQGAMLIWPRVVCGGTAYCLAHLVIHVFPSRLGACIWQWFMGPPGFSI
jgi:hypothetical protein